MSWVASGLERLLHKGEPTAQQKPPAATSPTRSSRAPSDLTQTDKQPSPRSRAESRPGSQETAGPSSRHSSEQQQLVEGPGSVYSLLPCIKQLRPSRGAADNLAAAVLGALPGVRLDSSWVVYPSGNKSGPQKAEACICILPDLQPPVRHLLSHIISMQLVAVVQAATLQLCCHTSRHVMLSVSSAEVNASVPDQLIDISKRAVG